MILTVKYFVKVIELEWKKLVHYNVDYFNAIN